jgi:hypothetical protein
LEYFAAVNPRRAFIDNRVDGGQSVVQMHRNIAEIFSNGIFPSRIMSTRNRLKDSGNNPEGEVLPRKATQGNDMLSDYITFGTTSISTS